MSLFSLCLTQMEPRCNAQSMEKHRLVVYTKLYTERTVVPADEVELKKRKWQACNYLALASIL